MSYPTVGAGPRNVCEVCGSDVRGQAIRGGCVLEKCQTCGHLLRDLPRLLDELRAAHPTVAMSTVPAVGEDPAVLAAMAAYCTAALPI